jgi:hypothetical protein
MKAIEYTVKPAPTQWWKETLQLMDQAHGNSHGEKWTREELYRGQKVQRPGGQKVRAGGGAGGQRLTGGGLIYKVDSHAEGEVI